ncbi:histidine kinase [Archangium violaceum]|uniref:sensor histidine kinase n=1 Tax=Archangium violaceum TaxID=83451 RepID=UPI001950688C|nr:ATP-binding protein [Archangium violaceum]QRN96063.1 histidine kinase [Archangium violaceum]
MTVDSPESRDLLWTKRRDSFICAILLVVGFVAHCLVSGTFRQEISLALLGWSASFATLGVVSGYGWVPEKWMGGCSGLISLVGATTLIHFTGGPRSPYFPMLGALPLTIAVFAPDTRVFTLLTSGGTLVAAVILDVLVGLPPREMLLQVSSFGMIGTVALFVVRTYRRTLHAEKAAQRERLEALEQLAESERLRRRAERERAEVERLVLVGQLAAGVAHEVNNPLAFVKSNLCFIQQELLREDGPLDRAELRDVLAETQQGVLRIQQIVRDLRRFSREGDGAEAEGRSEEAMREAERLASVRLRGLGEVSLEIPPGLPAVRLGQRQLVQVLVNLLLNAADAVEMAEPARRALIGVKARRVEGGVRLEVEDNGPGIPADVLPRLFDPFFTTKPPGKGTGLGLALCREYVSRVGGSLVAENRPEGGARFVLVLPTVPESAPTGA